MNRKRHPKVKKSTLSNPDAVTDKRPRLSLNNQPKSGAKTTSTEGCLQEGSLPRSLPLKNGTEIDMRDGLALLEIVQSLADSQPHHFQNLLALAKGRVVEDPASIKFLRNCGLLLRNKKINSDVQNVVNSAYHDTPEGPVITNPFNLANPAEARALEKFIEQGYLRLFGLLRDQGQDKTP